MAVCRGGAPLRDAVREGHKHVALLLRQHGGELGFNEAQMSGELCEYAKQGDLMSIDLLLRCGADPNAADYDVRACRAERAPSQRHRAPPCAER